MTTTVTRPVAGLLLLHRILPLRAALIVAARAPGRMAEPEEGINRTKLTSC